MLLTEYHKIITDSWKILKWYAQNTADYGKNEEFWQDLIRDTTMMTKNHHEHRFAVAMGLAVMEEIEGIWKNGQKDG